MANLLATAQKDLGWEATLVTLTESNLQAEPFRLPVHTTLASLDNFVLKRTGFKGLVSINRDRIASNFRRELHGADVIHFHWVNGVTSVEIAQEIAPSASLVWTLHDMNPFTGACHQSFGCEEFKESCSSCPAVRWFADKSVERSLLRKTESYRGARNLTFVSPSVWIQNLARESTALNGSDIQFIPNPVAGSFANSRDPAEDESGQRPRTSLRDFSVVSNDLDDPLKNVTFAVTAFLKMRKKYPDSRLFLAGRGGKQFSNQEGIELVGNLSESALVDLLRNSCALLLPSLAENAPVVVAEAACVGTPTIGLEIDSLKELTQIREGVHLASTAEEMAKIMEKLAEASTTIAGQRDRRTLRAIAQNTYEPGIIASRYLEVYEGVK